MDPQTLKLKLIYHADIAEVKEPHSITVPLDFNEYADEIHIDYTDSGYEFTVKFNDGKHITSQVFRYPYSGLHYNFQKLTLNASFPPVDEAKILQKFPGIIDTLYMDSLDKPAYFHLLYRSPLFQSALTTFTSSEGKFVSDETATGYRYHPESHSIFVPRGYSGTLYLHNFPHELAHQFDQTKPLNNPEQFIAIGMQNEVGANIFSAQVLQEAGVVVDANWDKEVYQFHQAYQQGSDIASLCARQANSFTGSHMTYAENIWAEAQSWRTIDGVPYFDEGSYEKVFVALSKPYQQNAAIVEWTANALFKIADDETLQSTADLSIMQNMLQHNSTFKNMHQKHPLLFAHLKNNLQKFDGFIERIRAAEGTKNEEAIRQQILKEIWTDLQSPKHEEAERIRLDNADKFDLHQYYTRDFYAQQL